MGDIKQEEKGGKTHYQKVLKPRLDEAEKRLDPPVDGSDKKAFCINTWKVYRVLCTKQDRKVVNKLIYKRVDNGEVLNINNYHEFKDMVKSNPFGFSTFMFDGSGLNLEEWFDVYNIMREALGNRYAGGSRTIKEEDMQEGLDEVPEDGGLEIDFDFEDTF